MYPLAEVAAPRPAERGRGRETVPMRGLRGCLRARLAARIFSHRGHIRGQPHKGGLVTLHTTQGIATATGGSIHEPVVVYTAYSQRVGVTAGELTEPLTVSLCVRILLTLTAT